MTNNTNTNNVLRFPFITNDEVLLAYVTNNPSACYQVIYDNNFADSMWVINMDGDMGEESDAGLFTLEDAKTIAIKITDMNPALDSEGRIVEALTKDFVCTGTQLLCTAIDREICYTFYQHGEDRFVGAYESINTYEELLTLNVLVDKYLQKKNYPGEF